LLAIESVTGPLKVVSTFPKASTAAKIGLLGSPTPATTLFDGWVSTTNCEATRPATLNVPVVTPGTLVLVASSEKLPAS
jgi:hypothetical protein